MKRWKELALFIVGLALVAWVSTHHHRPVTGRSVALSPETPGRSPSVPIEPTGGDGEDPGDSPFANVSGRVLSKDAKPLSGAMACAFCAECETWRNGTDAACEPSDARGRYVLRHLPPLDYQVSVSAEGHLPRVANKGAPIRLRGKDVELPDTELEEGGARVSGTVSDATGGPVAGATVQAIFAADELPVGRQLILTTKSGEAGAFALDVPEEHVLLLARADGYAAARLGAYAPARGLRLVVTPASRISGTVVTQADQSPVAGARVVAHGELGFEQVATSDAAGVFTVSGLRPGTYSLDASAAGWTGRRSGSVTVDLGDTADKIVIPVARAVQVKGTVRIGAEPCRTGDVVLRPAPGESNPNLTAHPDLAGQVVFEAVPAGSYQSAATCEGYGGESGPEVRVRDANLTGVAWTFKQGVTVTIRTRTPEGTSAGRTWIDLKPDARLATKPRSMRADADGIIRFLGIVEGSYVVEGPDVPTPMNVEVRGPTDVTVTTKPLGAIRVVVKDAQGQPNNQVAVTIVPKTPIVDKMPVAAPPAEPRGGGQYHVGPLPPGEYEVQIRDGVNPIAHAGGPDGVVQVRSGETVVVDATYGANSGIIRGRVVDGSGMPLENVWVSAEPSGTKKDGYTELLGFMTHSADARSLSNTEGRFEIGGLLETAVFSIVASRSLGGEARINNVSVGQNVELTLSTPGGLGGMVLDSAGRPASYFRIGVRGKDNGQRLMAEFGPDAQGTWHMDHVAPGAIEIDAQSPQGVAIIVRELAPSQQLKDIELRLQPRTIAQN
jgi:hypothetical protein